MYSIMKITAVVAIKLISMSDSVVVGKIHNIWLGTLVVGFYKESKRKQQSVVLQFHPIMMGSCLYSTNMQQIYNKYDRWRLICLWGHLHWSLSVCKYAGTGQNNPWTVQGQTELSVSICVFLAYQSATGQQLERCITTRCYLQSMDIIYMVLDSPRIVLKLLTCCSGTKQLLPCQSQNSPEIVQWWKICSSLPGESKKLAKDLWFFYHWASSPLWRDGWQSIDITSYNSFLTRMNAGAPNPVSAKKLLSLSNEH